MWRQVQASPAPAPGKHFLIETEDEDSSEGTVCFINNPEYLIVNDSDRHRLEDLHDIAEEEGLSESQEEEARQLVLSHPDLIHNMEEYEEARRTLHLSQNKQFVPPPPHVHPKPPACFGYESLVTTGSGEQKLMRDLKIGDQVVSDQTGSLTPFLGWLELNSKQKVDFLEIKTEDGEELVMTETHIVFYYEDGKPTSTYAKDLRPGNVLVGGSGEASTYSKYYSALILCLQGKVIQSMKSVEMTGSLAPLTQSGKIMSNNITASCCQYSRVAIYLGMHRIFSDASIPHAWSEIGFLPVKMFPELLLDNQESQSVEGTRTYVRFIKGVAR